MICGPTAVGKTTLSIDVARHFGTEIVSADSRQFYREMSIGTAKPSAEELAAVPHHLIDNLSINDSFTAGMYEREALDVIAKIFETHDVAVMVGGSGLFIRAVCEGFDSFKSEESEVTEEVKAKIRLLSLEEMQAEVAKLDPEYFQKVDKQNPRRLQRALEVIYSTGRKYSEQRSGAKAERPFNIFKIGLELPREQLYDRINRRVDEMVKNGLIEEATALYPFRDFQPLQTVGYQEIFDCLDGKCTLPEAMEKIKQYTRHYAKRQMTWFKKDDAVFWVDIRSDIMRHIDDWVKNLHKYSALDSEKHSYRGDNDWKSLEDFYVDIIEKKWKREPVLKLVKYIAASVLSTRLYALTSHDLLRITNKEYRHGNENTLWITVGNPRCKGGDRDKSEKCYLTYFLKDSKWNHEIICDPEYLIETFEKVVKKLGW